MKIFSNSFKFKQLRQNKFVVYKLMLICTCLYPLYIRTLQSFLIRWNKGAPNEGAKEQGAKGRRNKGRRNKEQGTKGEGAKEQGAHQKSQKNGKEILESTPPPSIFLPLSVWVAQRQMGVLPKHYYHLIKITIFVRTFKNS